MLQHLLVFKWIWFSVWRKKKKLLPVNSNQYFSIYFTFFIHKESYLQLIIGKTSSRTIHMLDYKQICTMECAYLNWAAEHNFGINNAYHVQLLEYLCAVEMQINDLWLKTFSIKRFLIWWKSWFIILNQKRDAFWKERQSRWWNKNIIDILKRLMCIKDRMRHICVNPYDYWCTAHIVYTISDTISK